MQKCIIRYDIISVLDKVCVVVTRSRESDDNGVARGKASVARDPRAIRVSPDRAAVVSSLIPGRFLHLFFSALQAIEAGDTAEARALIATLREAAGLKPASADPASSSPAPPRKSALKSLDVSPKLSSVTADAAFLGPGGLVRLIQELELRLAVALWDSGDRDSCVEIIKKELNVTLNTALPASIATAPAVPPTVPSFDVTIEDAEGAVAAVAPAVAPATAVAGSETPGVAAAATAAGGGSGGLSGDSGTGGASALSSFPSTLPPEFADHLSLLELTWQQHGWQGLKEGGLAPVLARLLAKEEAEGQGGGSGGGFGGASGRGVGVGALVGQATGWVGGAVGWIKGKGGVWKKTEGSQKVPFWLREPSDKKSLQQLLMHVRCPSLPRLEDAVAWELQRLERDEPDAFSRLSLPILHILTPPQLQSLAARFPSIATHPRMLALRAIQMLPRGMSLDTSAPTPESVDQILSYLDRIQPLLTSDHLRAKLLFARLTLSLVHGQADAALLLAFLSIIHNGPYGVFPPAKPHEEEAFAYFPLFASCPSPSDVKELVAQLFRNLFSSPSFSSSLASPASSSSSAPQFALPTSITSRPTFHSTPATSASAAVASSAQFPFAADSPEAAALVERAMHTWQPLIGQGKLDWSYVALLLAESRLCCADDPYYPVWLHLYLTSYQRQHAPDNPTAGSSALAELTGRCQLDFAAHNRRVWRAADSVHLDVIVKNVPVLAVKLFEVDSLRYLLSSPSDTEFSNLGSLHGLKPWYLAGRRGVFVVQLEGGGLCTRAIIRKGNLVHTATLTPRGLAIRMLNEDGALVLPTTAGPPSSSSAPAAAEPGGGSAAGLGWSVWVEGVEYAVGSGGDVLLPFTASSRECTPVLFDGCLAAVGASVQVPEESYNLNLHAWLNQPFLRPSADARFGVNAQDKSPGRRCLSGSGPSGNSGIAEQGRAGKGAEC
ncbi:unnamed protein product [Closterium sp. Yama58-4]|nr:unnamed protein product [Closterium sp. Yama58-4]